MIPFEMVFKRFPVCKIQVIWANNTRIIVFYYKLYQFLSVFCYMYLPLLLFCSNRGWFCTQNTGSCFVTHNIHLRKSSGSSYPPFIDCKFVIIILRVFSFIFVIHNSNTHVWTIKYSQEQC